MTAPARPAGFESLRGFLRHTAPAIVVVHTDLGDRTLQCASGAWRELADTIVSMKPHGVIEALDKKNLLLKTFDCARLATKAGEEMPVAVSAMQSDMQLYQRLLAEAYRHANETAFGQVVRLCEIAFKRLDAIELSWAKMHSRAARELERRSEAGEGEDGEGGFAQEVLGKLAAGALQGAIDAGAGVPNGKPNGKGKPHGTA